MDVAYYFLDIIKYVIAGISIFFTCYYWIRTQLDRRYETNILEYKKNLQSNTLPLRLQAYERAILLLERINPTQSVLRAHQQGMTAKQLQNILIDEINHEFYHNITQQLYINSPTWAIIKNIKEDTISMINNAFHSLPHNVSALELGKTILTHIGNLEYNPYDIAINELKKDIQKLF